MHTRELFGDNRGQNRKQREAYAEGHIYVKRVEFDGKSAARNHCTNRQYKANVDDVRADNIADGQVVLFLDNRRNRRDKFGQRRADCDKGDRDDSLGDAHISREFAAESYEMLRAADDKRRAENKEDNAF